MERQPKLEHAGQTCAGGEWRLQNVSKMLVNAGRRTAKEDGRSLGAHEGMSGDARSPLLYDGVAASTARCVCGCQSD